MPSSKRRKTSEGSTENEVDKECNDLSAPERKEDERREDVFFPELSYLPEKANSFGITTQNINGESDNLVPIARYFPTLRSFVSVRTPPNPMVRIRLNLPNLVVPPRLLQPEENAMRDLRILLKYLGFDVVDRVTLAFFTIGSELNVDKAARSFVNSHRFLNTAECKSPNREILQNMENCGFIEGFAWHRDGTFGPLIQFEKWDIHIHTATYIAREIYCYVLSMVDLSLLRNCLNVVVNCRNVSWKVFAPFELAKLRKLMSNSSPLKRGGKYLLDSSFYGQLAYKICNPLVVDTWKLTYLLSAEECQLKYPHLILPESITGLSDNKLVMHLSADEQLKIRFFITSSD